MHTTDHQLGCIQSLPGDLTGSMHCLQSGALAHGSWRVSIVNVPKPFASQLGVSGRLRVPVQSIGTPTTCWYHAVAFPLGARRDLRCELCRDRVPSPYTAFLHAMHTFRENPAPPDFSTVLPHVFCLLSPAKGTAIDLEFWLFASLVEQADSVFPHTPVCAWIHLALYNPYRHPFPLQIWDHRYGREDLPQGAGLTTRDFRVTIEATSRMRHGHRDLHLPPGETVTDLSFPCITLEGDSY